MWVIDNADKTPGHPWAFEKVIMLMARTNRRSFIVRLSNLKSTKKVEILQKIFGFSSFSCRIEALHTSPHFMMGRTQVHSFKEDLGIVEMLLIE